MTSALADLLAATAERAVDVYARQVATGYHPASARAFAIACATAFAEAYAEGFAEGVAEGMAEGESKGLAIGSAAERARLKALHDSHAKHGLEAQRWLMALELGSPPDDAADPPRFTLSN